MKVSYTLGHEDVWQLTRYVYRTVPRYRAQIRRLATFIPGSLLFFIWLGLRSFWPSLALAALFTAILLPLMYRRIKQEVIRTAANRPGILGEHTVEIDSEGMRERTSVNDNFCTWEGIQQIVNDKNHIYMFIDTSMAHVIPKRAFASEQDAKVFVDTAVAYWNASRKG